jgi:hypothetical protein
MQLLTIIKIVHLLGLVMGLGGALLLDATILSRGIMRPISEYLLHQMKILSRIVSAGLAILWVSGFALIWMNWLVKPEYIENPKLWAKIAIVCVLTLNGILIHAKIMPYMQKRLGQRMFESEPNKQLLLFTLVASVSAISWFTPFILGKASELNFVVPATTILLAYVSAVLVTWGGMVVLTGGITMLLASMREEFSEAKVSASFRNRMLTMEAGNGNMTSPAPAVATRRDQRSTMKDTNGRTTLHAVQ